MKSSNVFVKSAVASALVGAFGVAGAATITSAGVIDFAKENCQTTTQFTLPGATYTVGAGGATNQDFYVTFKLTNGTFFGSPTATVAPTNSNPNTAIFIDGGAGASNVTFRINGSDNAIGVGSTVTLAPFTSTVASCSAPVSVGAANGLLFLSGVVASPLESVTAPVAPAGDLGSFTNAVTITMAADTDNINLNPTPATDSRKVFGPSFDALETTTRARRAVTIVVGAQKEPNGVTAFSDNIDELEVSLSAPYDTSSVASLCFDDDADSICDAAELFSSGKVTVPAGDWEANGGFILNNDGTTFAPRTLGLNYQLNVKTDAGRPGMTAHPYAYTVANSDWVFQYANGTLLRSPWFLSDASNKSTLRLVNAGTASAAVVEAKAYLDSAPGTGINLVGLTSIAAKSGVNLPLTATSVPGLSTGPASRGYVEVIVAGDLINVDGTVITSGVTSGDRTIGVMRNVTQDAGIRTNAPY